MSFHWRFRTVLSLILFVVGVVAANLNFHMGVNFSPEVLTVVFFAAMALAFFIAGQWWLKRDLDEEP